LGNKLERLRKYLGRKLESLEGWKFREKIVGNWEEFGRRKDKRDQDQLNLLLTSMRAGKPTSRLLYNKQRKRKTTKSVETQIGEIKGRIGRRSVENDKNRKTT